MDFRLAVTSDIIGYTATEFPDFENIGIPLEFCVKAGAPSGLIDCAQSVVKILGEQTFRLRGEFLT